MLNTLSSVEFDPAGFVELDTTVDPAATGTVSRRVNRISTLDGGTVFNDFGFTDGDRTLEIRWRPANTAQQASVDRMLRLSQQVVVSTPAGVFLAVPQTFTPGGDSSRLTLLVAERLSI